MFKFGSNSLRRLQGVDPILIDVFKTAITYSPFDFGIAWMGGLRTDQDQNKLYKAGKSQRDGYTKRSKHQPSLIDGYGKAVDIFAYDPDTGKATWDEDILTAISDHILCIAEEKGVELRWGNDWDRDGIPVQSDPDERFSDMPHFELVE